MYPFWDLAVWPVIQAAGAERIVEIGALRGSTTELMLEQLAPTVELHVIDPAPAFDPAEHEQRFAGRYHFHRRPSLDALPSLPAFDVALIDGDHNWYTVFHELELLRDGSDREARPLPVLVLHDVGWPYGRRDLYYDPARVPDEYRHAYAEKGMRRGSSDLVDRGGINATMKNARHEGGPRNGVMTAVDDFVAAHPHPVRVVVLPVFFGLAIVAEDRRLAAQPELAAVLDELESPEAGTRLADLAESMRLQAVIHQQTSVRHEQRRADAVARRYLDVVKAALLDDHYLENEARLADLLERAAGGNPPDRRALRDPNRLLQPTMRRLRAAHDAGHTHDDDGLAVYFPFATMGRTRLEHLERSLDEVRAAGIAGDLVECGVGRGGGAVFMRAFLEAHDLIATRVWVADTFRAEGPDADLAPDLNHVRDAFARFDLFDDRITFLVGDYDQTLTDQPPGRIALLRVGPGLGSDAALVLDQLYDRVSQGGVIIIDDHTAEAGAAVDEFRARRGIVDDLERVDWSAIAWRKGAVTDATTAAAVADAAAEPLRRAPLAPAATAELDLSVVVVFYNMRREAARTLHALSRAYQRGIDDLRYEVIVLENGSAPDQRLGEDLVASFGPEFRYVDMGAEALPSPTPALNHGIAMSRGRVVALMIDGAHVLTPGVLRHAMAGIDAYEPAIVVTQQWYVGPGQQPEAMLEGYEQGYEDELFAQIDWPVDGYRLFDIGNFIGDRDWFDGLWESNCLFVPRSVLQQVGGYDDSFSMPGAGYANLELYERLGSSPDLTVVSILGEGSFHQMHGGTTTNLPGTEDRHDTLASYAEHFEDLRGRPFIGHRKPIHYVGSMVEEARRTRARRRVAPYFADAANGLDGRPEAPVPMSHELVEEFVDGYWRSLLWRQPTWFGRRVYKLPNDLFAYQELIARVQPDWIIETGTGNGGRAAFLASMCDLVGRGQIVSVDHNVDAGRPEHPRIHYVEAVAWEPPAAEQVRTIVGSEPNALVILGSSTSARRTRQEFRAFSPLVPVGSYVVVENTIVNGHPVWADFGAGPAEGVKSVVQQRDAFVRDAEMDKYKVTFNPGGFLKRVK